MKLKPTILIVKVNFCDPLFPVRNLSEYGIRLSLISILYNESGNGSSYCRDSPSNLTQPHTTALKHTRKYGTSTCITMHELYAKDLDPPLRQYGTFKFTSKWLTQIETAVINIGKQASSSRTFYLFVLFYFDWRFPIYFPSVCLL